MTAISQKTEMGSRLEDFIQLAQKGTKIHAKTELRTVPLKQKVHPDETNDMSDELDTYLLVADYTFDIKNKSHMRDLFPCLTKTYMFAALGESAESRRINKNIANARLRMDYDRLKSVNIDCDEIYFE